MNIKFIRSRITFSPSNQVNIRARQTTNLPKYVPKQCIFLVFRRIIIVALVYVYRKGDPAIRGPAAAGGDSPLHIRAFPAEGVAGVGGPATIPGKFQHSALCKPFGFGVASGHRLFQCSEGAQQQEALSRHMISYVRGLVIKWKQCRECK